MGTSQCLQTGRLLGKEQHPAVHILRQNIYLYTHKHIHTHIQTMQLRNVSHTLKTPETGKELVYNCIKHNRLLLNTLPCCESSLSVHRCHEKIIDLTLYVIWHNFKSPNRLRARTLVLHEMHLVSGIIKNLLTKARSLRLSSPCRNHACSR